MLYETRALQGRLQCISFARNRNGIAHHGVMIIENRICKAFHLRGFPHRQVFVQVLEPAGHKQRKKDDHLITSNDCKSALF